MFNHLEINHLQIQEPNCAYPVQKTLVRWSGIVASNKFNVGVNNHSVRPRMIFCKANESREKWNFTTIFQWDTDRVALKGHQLHKSKSVPSWALRFSGLYSKILIAFDNRIWFPNNFPDTGWLNPDII